jgi:hypothetical protein
MSITKKATFDRDKLAKGYAKRHMETDSGVEQINYLPANAPEREIRLLEVNRLIAESTELEPIDFGVDTSSPEAHTLLVLDITPLQWNAILKKKLSLPPGWDLDGYKILQKRH